MTTEDIVSIIKQIQKSQTNIKLFTAVPMGVLMIFYFFSYATLIDHGLTGALYVEIITTILFVFTLIYLNKVSFFLVKWLYKRREFHRSIIDKMTSTSINKTAEQLSQELELK